jgi:hypothetical protein
VRAKRPCYKEPIAVCSDCGRERRCRGARTDAPLCNTCRRKGSTWKAPIALCSVCERTRPCHHARSERPICPSCSHNQPSRLEACAFCGTLAIVAARTLGGAECKSCRSRRLPSQITCRHCQRRARPAAAQAGLCERCAGERVAQICRGCGAEEQNYADGHCARCSLRAHLQRLTQTGESTAAHALKDYLAALTDSAKPSSTLNWMTCSRGYDTLRELISGALPLTHEALDAIDRGPSTIYLRSALVSHGALPERYKQTAALAAFIDREILRVPDGPGRLHLRTFATWKVQHELARAERAGTAKRSSHQHARTQIHLAAELLAWLAQHSVAVEDLRQEHLDFWLAEGSTHRRRVRAFITWTVRHRITGPLTAIPSATQRHVDPLETHQRLQLIRRLLTDESLDLRDRVAGSLVLLFAQPISRLLLLTTDDVHDRQGHVFLGLGREPLLLPEPLATLTQQLKNSLPAHATETANAGSQWLFPSRRFDASLSEDHLRERLRTLGIMSLPARNSAATQLAQTLPAAILADLLGMATNTAERWTQLANGDWTRYAATR